MPAMDEDFHPALFTSHEAVEQAFYDALERADLDALMACWSEDDDIVCVHPSGPRMVGVEAVRRAFSQMLENGPVHIRPLALHVQVGMMFAVHSLVEQVMVRTQRGEGTLSLFATNVYVKTPNGWRMSMHHASPIPDESVVEQSFEVQRPSILH